MDKVVVRSRNPSETLRLGRQIGRLLRPGDVVALSGELGAGKTLMIKGLAEGAGVKKSVYVSSPSFTLIHEYSGPIPFYHMDFFRLGEEDLLALGVEDYMEGQGITAIEWAERACFLLPKERLEIHIQYAGPKTRLIEIIPQGKRYEGLVQTLSSQIARGSLEPSLE
ncbi:MAG: tRNA (adenosine(37)-N6)-threonylcarbamoyltransferase complex ATPase subunit type 1 TsaE [Desulfobacterota bacterium]|nr:tRNA (adenosine(37)-N6)-threonylcarbamoyltransferase complex ATPase subunit type 1 TsaE [Thermodesulfobacteriota bacterium]